MAWSVTMSAGVTFYSTVYMPPLWRQLQGLAGDISGWAKPDVVQQVRWAADDVQTLYWAIQLSNGIRIGFAALLAPWPKLRLGVGLASFLLGAHQFKEFYNSIQSEISTLNMVAAQNGIPIKISLTPNVPGLLNLVASAVSLQINPAGQVETFREVIANAREKKFPSAAAKLVELASELKRDYGSLIDIEFQFNPNALPIPVPPGPFII